MGGNHTTPNRAPDALQLTAQRYTAARSFMLRKARPIDRALFLYALEGGDAEGVVRELSAYQNADGGFGNALEPDFRLPDSSAMATSVALQYVSRLHPRETPRLVENTLRYLGATLDTAAQRWDPVPPSVERHPRAPWWEYANWRANRINPTVELVGYLWEFSGAFPRELVPKLTRQALSLLAGHEGPLGMHDLLAYLRLAARLPEPLAVEFYDLLDGHARQEVATERAQWGGYVLQPVQVAPSPQAHYAAALGPAIEENLDHLIETQGDDGSWLPTWSWGRFPQDWEVAKVEWQGALTAENVSILAAYDRIAR